MEITARSLPEAGGLAAHEGEEFALVMAGSIEVYNEHYVPTRLNFGDSIYMDSTSGDPPRRETADRPNLPANDLPLRIISCEA